MARKDKRSHPAAPLYYPGNAAVNQAEQFSGSVTTPWPQITDTPTTRDGYGITDVYTIAEADAEFLTAAEADALFLTPAEGDAAYSPLGHTHDDRYYTETEVDALFAAIDYPVDSVFGRTGAVVAAANDYTFAQLASKPTTISGYGITDAYTKTEVDSGFLPITGGTLTGNLLFSPDGTKDIGASGATRPGTIWLTTGWDMNDGTVRATGLIEASRLDFGTVTNHDFGIFTNATLRFRLTAAGHLIAHADNSFDIGATGANRPRDIYVAGQMKLEGTAPAVRYTNSVANAAVAVTLGSTGPTGSTAGAPRGWLPVSINGTTRYMPFW